MKLIYISAVPWKSVSQRPHFFAKYALENEVDELLWIEPYPSRFPNISDLNLARYRSEPHGVKVLPGLKVISMRNVVPIEPAIPIFKLLNRAALKKVIDEVKHFITSETILVVGKPCLLSSILISKFDWKSIWFDAMDDFPSFYKGISKIHMRKMEDMIADNSDKVICSSHALIDKFSRKGLCNKLKLVLNACENSLERIKQSSKCDSIDKKLVFGYIGTISNWFDWDWTINLAASNPSCIVRLIGPMKIRKPFNLPSNIHIEPAIPHYEIMQTLSTFDFAIIPFKQNELTKHVDPVKYYEYSLAGKIILSTPFGEMIWHYKKNEGLISKLSNIIKIPLGTLIISNDNKVPRWNARFSQLFFSDQG